MAWLRLTKPVQHARRGKPVRNQPDRGLIIADRDPGTRPEETIGIADIETVPRQKLLQLQALIKGKHALIARPFLHERCTAAHSVGEIPDRQRVSFRRIVFHDDAKIRQHQKRRAAGAGRQIGRASCRERV